MEWFWSLKWDPEVGEKQVEERSEKKHIPFFWDHFGGLLEVILGQLSGTVLGSKNSAPGWSRRRQDAEADKRRQNAGRMRKDLEPATSTPSPMYRFLAEIWQDFLQKRT